MSEFCPMITQCGWYNPYCSERIKLETLRNLEKDWWGYGKDRGNTIRERSENALRTNEDNNDA